MERDCVLVSIDDPNDLRALKRVLSLDITEKQAVVVVCVGEETEEEQGASLSDQVTDVFSETVFSAENAGKPVKLSALKGTDHTLVLLEDAASLRASQLWLNP